MRRCASSASRQRQEYSDSPSWDLFRSRMAMSPVGRSRSRAKICSGAAKRMRQIRGNEISMIFQEPMTSLNPVFSVGEQIAEALRDHKGMGRREAWQAAIDMLARVRIPEGGSGRGNIRISSPAACGSG